jgi:hypothetical protein
MGNHVESESNKCPQKHRVITKFYTDNLYTPSYNLVSHKPIKYQC